MTSRLRRIAFAPFLVPALVFAGCGDDSASQVPPRTATPTAVTAAPATPPAAAAAAAAPVVPTVGTAVGTPLTLPELAKAMLALKLPADRTGVFATTADGIAYQIVVSPEGGTAFAAALARSLGSVSTTSVTWPPPAPPLSVEVLAIRGGTTLRETPNTRGTPVTVLPDGAFFVSLSGAIAGSPSAHEGEGAWTYGVASNGRFGWVTGSSVAVEEGCILSLDTLAGALSVSLDDEALGSSLVGNVHVSREGRSNRGTFVIAPSYVVLLQRPANCHSATIDTRIDLDVAVEEFHHALDRDHGDTFIAIATEPQDGNDESNWGFYPPRATEPSFSVQLATGPLVPTSRRARVHIGTRRGPGGTRGYWPISIERRGEPAVFYTSEGSAFVEVPTEAPAATP